MNYYSLPNTPQNSNPSISTASKPSHGEKTTSNSFDSMFSFFTIPVPQVPEQTSKSPKHAPQQIREGEKYFVLTSDLLRLKQSDAAARLDIHPSTFSKKWRQSLPDRKWPYRKHCKIERQIKKLKEQGDSLSEGQLKELLSVRDKNLEPAVIVISDSDTTVQQPKTATKPTPTPQTATQPTALPTTQPTATATAPTTPPTTAHATPTTSPHTTKTPTTSTSGIHNPPSNNTGVPSTNNAPLPNIAQLLPFPPHQSTSSTSAGSGALLPTSTLSIPPLTAGTAL